MLKKLTIILIIVLSMISVASYAQTKGTLTAFGSLGGNFSWLDSTRADNYTNKLGFQLGAGVFYALMDNVSLGGGLYGFLSQGSNFTATENQGLTEGTSGLSIETEGIQHLLYLQIPILAKINTPTGLNFIVGPTFGILLGAERNVTAKSDGQTYDPNSVGVRNGGNKEDFNTLDIGLKAGIGYYFKLDEKMSASFGLSYQHGFMNVATDDFDEKLHNRTITLDLSIFYDL